ncbi:unnamed protein product [Nippostrongylus brasiliensis]|uniref:Type II toxin-antitoxin system PemK/MazF family toxin n=1 Tax=Nippostrongylus brasiliensis TaxID=27835 RepID=A0A0N4YD90_NIPBR|nr:unnamed protein product [Nippostrongylus brasiliensis]
MDDADHSREPGRPKWRGREMAEVGGVWVQVYPCESDRLPSALTDQILIVGECSRPHTKGGEDGRGRVSGIVVIPTLAAHIGRHIAPPRFHP